MEVEIKLHAFLIWVVTRGEWSVSRCGCFVHREDPPVTNSRRLGRPQNQSGREAKEKSTFPYRKFNSGRKARSQLLY